MPCVTGLCCLHLLHVMGFETVAPAAHTEIGPGFVRCLYSFHGPWNRILLYLTNIVSVKVVDA
jgi:hypothetical protein